MVLMPVCVFAAKVAAQNAVLDKNWEEYEEYYAEHEQELAEHEQELNERSSKVRHSLSTLWFC